MCIGGRLAVGVVLLVFLSAACFAQPSVSRMAERHLDAAELWKVASADQLRLVNGAVELERGMLYEDDGPASGYSYKPNQEVISDKVMIKKELIIDHPAAEQATLLVGQGGELQAIINGTPAALSDAGKLGNYFRYYRFDPKLLKEGKNEIILKGSGKVWIARDDEFAAGSAERPHHSNRSARSTDGGKTWDYERQGTKGDIDGEYYVRLLLDQYRAGGSLTLPVMDVGTLEPATILGPLAKLGPVRASAEVEGDQKLVKVLLRSGPSFSPTSANWSEWTELKDATTPTGRFIQLKLDLSTTDPLKTPRLKGLRLQAMTEPAVDWTNHLKMLEQHNPAIIRSSVPFQYEPFDHPTLREFRQQYKLDDVVKDAKTELELISALSVWTHGRLQGGHLNKVYPQWNALEILKPFEDSRPVGGFCQQYNLVFLQACESFGIPGRAISVGRGQPGNVTGGHEVVELWSNQFGKWIYVDAWSPWYISDAGTGIPLSLLEMLQRRDASLKGQPYPAVKEVVLAVDPRKPWTKLEQVYPCLELRMIPRSNFLEQKSPLPLNQGMRGWFWTGHWVWKNETFSVSPIYSHFVQREGDWNWTLNQAEMRLEATGTPGELRVHLDSVTPSFEAYLTKIDEGDTQAVTESFIWKLQPGRNLLEVRPRNSAGRQGIASSIVIEYSQ